MKRVVLDTNVFVSMVLGGQVGKINDGWRAEKFLLIVSDDIVSEYLNVLQRPKLHLSSDTIATIVSRIYRKAEFSMPAEHIFLIKDDPSDDKFLEAAIAGNADFIVSGDKHLLDIKQFQSVPIIIARDFIEILKTT